MNSRIGVIGMKIKRVFDEQSVEFHVLYEGYLNAKLEQIIADLTKEGYNQITTTTPHESEVDSE